MSKKKGRPPVAQSIRENILELIAAGESLSAICRLPGMPTRQAVYNWLTSDKVFFDRYAQATDFRADVLFDDILQIANAIDGTPENSPAAARVKIDAIKWVLSKMNPKKYSDRQQVELTGNDSDPPPRIVIEYIDPKAK